MIAREIMTATPAVISQDESIRRAAGIMRDEEVGMLPVVDDAKSMALVGIITDRDIVVRHVAECSDDCAVKDHMSSRNIATVKDEDDASTVMDVMQTHQIRRVPVVSSTGRLIGVIAQADIATCDEIPKEDLADTVKEISMP